jgi:hypothetical protein
MITSKLQALGAVAGGQVAPSTETAPPPSSDPVDPALDPTSWPQASASSIDLPAIVA